MKRNEMLEERRNKISIEWLEQCQEEHRQPSLVLQERWQELSIDILN
jgi:hypothetical protein